MEPPEEDIPSYPEQSIKRDLVQKAVEGAVGVVPAVGGAVQPFVALVLAGPLERRRADWFNLLAERIRALEESSEALRSQSLSENEEFVTAAVIASQAAMATHQQELREALANAAINAALPGAPDADTQKIYLRLIEQLTPSHLRLLALLHDPGAFFDDANISRPDIMMGGRRQLVVAGMSEMDGRDAFLDRLMSDLNAAGLTNTGGLNVTMTGAGMWQSTSTSWGRAFLRFIREPHA